MRVKQINAVSVQNGRGEVSQEKFKTKKLNGARENSKLDVSRSQVWTKAAGQLVEKKQDSLSRLFFCHCEQQQQSKIPCVPPFKVSSSAALLTAWHSHFVSSSLSWSGCSYSEKDRCRRWQLVVVAELKRKCPVRSVHPHCGQDKGAINISIPN